MTRDEYEARWRRLDDELRAAIELVEEGHRARVQALDLWWQAVAPGVPAPAMSPAPGEGPKRRRRPGELRAEICELLRASLFRALRELIDDGLLQRVQRGQGRSATIYRKTPRP